MSGPGEKPGATPSELRSAVTAAAARIHEIIDAAERAGTDIRREAEADAERYLAARRREADALITDVQNRVARIREEAAALAAALGERTPEPAQAPAAPEPAAAPDPSLAADAPAAAPDPSPGERRGDAEELRVRALLRATQMAVAGDSREAIDRVLREEFGLEQTGPLLDQVLGP